VAEQQSQLSIPVFWQLLGGVFARLLGEKAHAELSITIRAGHVQTVNVNRHYLPTELPK